MLRSSVHLWTLGSGLTAVSPSIIQTLFCPPVEDLTWFLRRALADLLYEMHHCRKAWRHNSISEYLVSEVWNLTLPPTFIPLSIHLFTVNQQLWLLNICLFQPSFTPNWINTLEILAVGPVHATAMWEHDIYVFHCGCDWPACRCLATLSCTLASVSDLKGKQRQSCSE